VGELQMDWLRSEDLKEENVLTAPVWTIPRQDVFSASKFTRVQFAPLNSENGVLLDKFLVMQDYIEK
jgi:hypothetical protein